MKTLEETTKGRFNLLSHRPFLAALIVRIHFGFAVAVTNTRVALPSVGGRG